MKATKTTTPAKEQDKFNLRFPEGMREQVEEAAEYEDRSMNSEMIRAIRTWLDRQTAIKRWAPPMLIDEIEHRAAEAGVGFGEMLNAVLAAGLREDAPQVLYISVAPGSTAQDIRAALDATRDAAPPNTPIFIDHQPRPIEQPPTKP
jgi:hypothetical protein